MVCDLNPLAFSDIIGFLCPTLEDETEVATLTLTWLA